MRNPGIPESPQRPQHVKVGDKEHPDPGHPQTDRTFFLTCHPLGPLVAAGGPGQHSLLNAADSLQRPVPLPAGCVQLGLVLQSQVPLLWRGHAEGVSQLTKSQGRRCLWEISQMNYSGNRK